MSRSEGITSFDEDDDGSSATFSEGPVISDRSPEPKSGGDRRRRARGISPGSARGRPAKRSVGPIKLDIRSIRGAATSMLTIAVAGVLAVVCILYFTVFKNVNFDYQFYGALAAAMVVMLLIGYIGARLMGVNE